MSIIDKPPLRVKREYDLEEPVALAVEKYATFIDSTPDHVVNSALKILLWKDKHFMDFCIFGCRFPRTTSSSRPWPCGRRLFFTS